jgi:phosphoribosylamine---glycine ligase
MPRDVLVVGGGGREAALAWKLSQSPELGTLYVTHDNPGFPAGVARLPDGDVAEQSAALGIQLVVVGPEGPLAAGLVDRCRALGVPAFGPTAAAAQLEASKGFAKDFMARHGVPTAAYSRHGDAAGAHGAVTGACVVKADGLAAGKGVLMCPTADDAHAAIDTIFDGAFGAAGASVVIEEWMQGEEVSVFALCDGWSYVLLPAAQDHKRRFDGDEGPNTGGMGAYVPAPALDAGLMARVEAEILRPVLAGMIAEDMPFTGVLYAGLMLTADGPRVVEFNVRFGDPECQPLMAMLDEDLLPILLHCATGTLDARPLRTRDGAACCVVMVSGGYPGSYPKGLPISGLDAVPEHVVVFHAGTRSDDGILVTNGGRVLGVTALGIDIREARTRAYDGVAHITWDGAAFRRDIANRALERTP